MAAAPMSFERLAWENNSTDAPGKSESPNEMDQQEVDPCCSSIMNGAQLAERMSFRNRDGKELCVTPVIVDFRRVLQINSEVNIIPEVPNRDLLHAVVALYDTSLSEMTPDVLYASACDKWAKTIILIKDTNDCIADMNETDAATETEAKAEADNNDILDNAGDKEKEDKEKSKEEKDTAAGDDDEDEDVYQADEDKPSVFAEVFSDAEEKPTEESGEEEEEEEDDYSHGINAFLTRVKTRKATRKPKEKELTSECVGIENRIVGAATFEKTYCKPGEKIIHLTLLAVRKKYRKWGIGRFLLAQIKDMLVVGQYDAVVVHADNSALEFFERYGFSDDLVLNSRWSELAEQFTNCTLMCYLPPFTSQTVSSESIPELDIIAMEREIKKWRGKSMEAYRSEVSCMNRLRHEIIHLRALVSSQQDVITTLAAENDRLRKDKYRAEKDFLEYRLLSTKAASNGTTFTEMLNTVLHSDEEDEISSEDLIRELEVKGHIEDSPLMDEQEQDDEGDTERYMLGGEAAASEPYDHAKDTQDFFRINKDFYEAIKQDRDIGIKYTVKMVYKAMLTSTLEKDYHHRLSNLQDTGMVTRLYYCGTLEKPERLSSILKTGFSEEDFSDGVYGKGLYFSKYPSKASQFSAPGNLLIAEVGLGKTQTLLQKDRTRSSPTEGYDSVITPGRLLSSGDGEGMLCQEYIIFDAAQVLPLYLIEYMTE